MALVVKLNNCELGQLPAEERQQLPSVQPARRTGAVCVLCVCFTSTGDNDSNSIPGSQQQQQLSTLDKLSSSGLTWRDLVTRALARQINSLDVVVAGRTFFCRANF